MDRLVVACVLAFTAVWFVAVLSWVGFRRWRAGGQGGTSVAIALAFMGGPLVLAMMVAAVAISQPSGVVRIWLIAASVAVIFLPTGALTLMRAFQAVVRTARKRDQAP